MNCFSPKIGGKTSLLDSASCLGDKRVSQIEYVRGFEGMEMTIGIYLCGFLFGKYTKHEIKNF